MIYIIILFYLIIGFIIAKLSINYVYPNERKQKIYSDFLLKIFIETVLFWPIVLLLCIYSLIKGE
jgi:hypothetical protein